MAISLRTNIAALAANQYLNASNDRLNQSMGRLASGLRINTAGDDAAGLAISEQFKANLSSLAQAKRNANDGVSLIQTAEAAMGEVSSILIRLRELAVYAATDTLSSTQRGFLDDELVQLRSELDRIGQTAEFNGLNLLSGTFAASTAALTFQVDLSGNINRQITVQIGTVSPTSLGIETIGYTSTSAARASLSVVDAAIQTISQQRATMGAAQSRLQAAINNISTQYTNVSAANSRIRDVDVAEETATLTRNQILMQSGVSVLAQANQIPSLALSLLG